ncbi:hypothetical protein EB796_023461 [Bugula neritina]|uniref:Uncharacterized protein n=1 Tax=Bugula neritina TaxID=10212 RepID=A0A7J7IWL2_BUGNE|nr:hypothetical protein EB796_023461 [Bugula neritina]
MRLFKNVTLGKCQHLLKTSRLHYGLLSRTYCQQKTAPSSATNTNPTGTTANKAAGNEYKNLEYFGYNNLTFYDMEIEMKKHRMPQPSNSN